MRSLLFASLVLSPLAAFGQVAYSQDFQGTVGPEWSSSSTTDVNGANRRGLGAFDNATQTLTLGGFTPGVSATLAFDFYCLDSWDGTSVSGPDTFFAQIAGTDVLRATFSNIDESPFYAQTYSPATPLGGAPVPADTGADEKDTLTSYNAFGYGNSVYKFGGGTNPLFTFVPTSSTVVFSFGATGLEALPNEGWAIDNVRVAQAVPEPRSVAALGLGALALARRRARR